jgi:hypothetical protein
MILSRTYANRADIPTGAEALYAKVGNLFIRRDATTPNDLIADNPWDASNWNLTAQGAFIQKHGMEMANAFAKNAGTTVGGLKPKFTPQRDLTVIVQRRNLSTGGTGDGASYDALATGLATKV